jgi:hypothetical protein
VWLTEGLHQSEGDSTTARQSAAGIPDRIQTDLLVQSRLDPDPEGVIMRRPYVCEYNEVLHVRHYVVAPVLSHWCRGIMT